MDVVEGISASPISYTLEGKRKKLYVSLLMVHKVSYQEKKYTSKISLPHRESIFLLLRATCYPRKQP